MNLGPLPFDAKSRHSSPQTQRKAVMTTTAISIAVVRLALLHCIRKSTGSNLGPEHPSRGSPHFLQANIGIVAITGQRTLRFTSFPIQVTSESATEVRRQDRTAGRLGTAATAYLSASVAPAPSSRSSDFCTKAPRSWKTDVSEEHIASISACCLFLIVPRLAYSSFMKMEAILFSETSASLQTTVM